MDWHWFFFIIISKIYLQIINIVIPVWIYLPLWHHNQLCVYTQGRMLLRRNLKEEKWQGFKGIQQQIKAWTSREAAVMKSIKYREFQKNFVATTEIDSHTQAKGTSTKKRLPNPWWAHLITWGFFFLFQEQLIYLDILYTLLYTYISCEPVIILWDTKFHNNVRLYVLAL